MKRTSPKPRRQEEIFMALMLAMVAGIMEDMAHQTDNHLVFFDAAMQACLAQGIPPRHQIEVMNALAELEKTINIEVGKITRRGICPN